MLLTVRGRVLCKALTHPHLTQEEIGESLGIPFQNVNRALADLVEADILVKVRAERRSHFVPGPMLRWSSDLAIMAELLKTVYVKDYYLDGDDS